MIATMLDAARAASYLSISRDQLYRLARSGELPHTRRGRRFRFRQEDLDAYLAQPSSRSEHLLASSRELFVKVFDATPLPISISTLVEGRLLDVNASLLQLTGYTREEIIGRTTLEINIYSHPEDRARITELLRAQGAIRDLEINFRIKSGEVLTGQLSAEIIEFKEQKCVLATVTDITERRRLENAVRLRAEELAEANRIKDEFLATLSHELRTPLTSILGWAHLLSTGDLSRETSARALDTIQRNARSQVQLIEDLIDLSRVITGKLHLEVLPTNLASVIDAAIEVVRPAAVARGVRLTTRLDRAVTISGDPDRLQQVVWNLLSNSIKFTGTNGVVKIVLKQEAGEAQVVISDTGIGIREEFLPHVFDRFRQADSTSTRAYGGLGLGLALVRHVTELHGGTVSAESPGEGQGATFTLKLPLAAAAAAMDPRARAVRSAANRSPAEADMHALEDLRVLIVDDEEDARDLVQTVLERCGALVTTAASAPEAIAFIERARPDVLVCDIGMPGEDGYALISRVRALAEGHGGSTPAVALTAYAREEDRRRALDAGFQVHVAKPIKPSELVAVVAGLAGQIRKA
ncbi:MAG TPA: ATP-binding protein [Pyrinomonadaceae bacterium]|jgi:PAS domain S-box-containing protein/excisionase family DNA binding protein